MKQEEYNLEAEAQAFTDRIEERVQYGFVPDLRNLRECEYFYKSFWRKPLYVSLYFEEIVRRYIAEFEAHLVPGSVILDFGCGPGYCALELARAGFKVIAVDVSSGAINVAKSYLQDCLMLGESLDIEYLVGGIDLVENLSEIDGVLFSGVLHHLPNCGEAVESIKRKLRKGGMVVAHEPQHHEFTLDDAQMVATLRIFLEFAGVWYENIVTGNDAFNFSSYVKEVHTEFTLERDTTEQGGQSPNDLSVDGDQIKAILGSAFSELASVPTFSFTYRMLGGLRADAEIDEVFAKALARFDTEMVDKGVMNANYFFWTGIR